MEFFVLLAQSIRIIKLHTFRLAAAIPRYWQKSNLG